MKHLPLLLATALLLSCGDSPQPVCTPGQSVVCVGPGGCAGRQICRGEGQNFTDCLCTGATAPDADPAIDRDAGADLAVTQPPAVDAVARDMASDVAVDRAPEGTPDLRTPLPAFMAVPPCSSEADYLTTTTVTSTATLRFSPPCVKVPRGTAVRFTMDFSLHPLRPSGMRGDVANNPIQATNFGTEASFTFNQTGFFGFYCAIHGASDNGTIMAGVVWVTEGNAPPPDAGGGSRMLAILPSSHDFGSVAVGTSSDSFLVTVVNAGAAIIGGLAVNLNGLEFVAPAAENGCAGVLALSPGASCTVGVQFKPSSRGIKAGSVIASGGGQTVVTALSGRGQSPPMLLINPTAAMLLGQTGTSGTPLTFTVANAGDGATGALTAALGGTDAGSFKIISNACLAPLSAGGTCQIAVALNAVTAGIKSASLTISSPHGGMATATLAGTAN